MAQAGRRWQRSIFPWLKSQGFVQCHSDTCVFSKTETRETPSGPREETLRLGVYVDDLAIVYEQDDDYSLYHSFTTALKERWSVEDEGELSDLLGIEFSRDGDVIQLGSDTTYVAQVRMWRTPGSASRPGMPPTPGGRHSRAAVQGGGRSPGRRPPTPGWAASRAANGRRRPPRYPLITPCEIFCPCNLGCAGEVAAFCRSSALCWAGPVLDE